MTIDPDPDGLHRRRQQRGRVAVRATQRRRRSPWRWLLCGCLAFVLCSVVGTASLRWFAPPTSAFMLAARIGAVLAGDRGFTLAQRWLPLDAQSAWAAVAVIAAEDQKFRHHRGFDFDSMRAALTAYGRGAKLRGASTLTQQLAKNLYLWSGRSWLRKGLEAWFTVLLEAFLDKRRLLELYLNVVEFGPGVYGVEAASLRYFGHGAERLDVEEAALLAAVLPNPKRYRVDAPSVYVRARQRWILQQMRQLGGAAVVAGLFRLNLVGPNLFAH